jgi:hypothetical protein
MNTVYTMNGFPTSNQANQPQGSEVRYHDANIDALYANGAPSPEITFPAELEVLEAVMKAWAAAGNLFGNLLQPGVLVSSSVVSFVLETAAVLNGEKSRRGLSFQDWALLLKPGEDTKVGPVQLSEGAIATLKEMAGKDLPTLIQKWVTSVGFEDLIGTMKIYVGEVQPR